jgi:predicted ATP-binding protein involved in virulence
MWKVLDKYVPELPRPVDVRGLSLWFETADGAVVPLSALSDGERAILLIFGEIALRAPRNGVVLIDEVEQHLHPRWQRAVLDGLPALVPSAQIFITTQSPYVAACAPDDTIVVGDWKNRGE